MPEAQTAAQAAAAISRPGALFADAPPSADLNLDELFPNPDQQPQVAAPVPAEPPQAAPAPSEPFLGTYRTKEEAIKGYEEKDRYIAKLRQDLLDAQSKLPQPKPEPVADPAEALYDQIAKAASSQDKKGYVQAQAELIRSVLAPYQDLLGEVARERAIRTAEARTPGVREFMGSETFKQVGERLPVLRDAIAQLEHNPQAAQAQLDQLMELAKLAGDGLRMPDLLKAQAQAAPAVAQTQPRPTLSQTTPTPSQQTANYNPRDVEAMLSTPEGRKALLERYNRQGVGDVRLASVRL